MIHNLTTPYFMTFLRQNYSQDVLVDYCYCLSSVSW